MLVNLHTLCENFVVNFQVFTKLLSKLISLKIYFPLTEHLWIWGGGGGQNAVQHARWMFSGVRKLYIKA